MATNIEATNFGERVSSIAATKADISRLEGKIDTTNEGLSWQFRWLMAPIPLALAASAFNVISLLR